ncbi:hypothetical protein SDC9_69461 [bioreactor metagenome]|uniref:Uncharacterized protein n=1 Tax=bioreactor metagenome TaxID=1076179 RepID=A0A644Y3S2_9ZZZZ
MTGAGQVDLFPTGIPYRRIVGRDQHCRTGLRQLPQGPDDHRGIVLVQRPGGLVGQDEGRLPDDQACEGEPLLLATAEVVGRLLGSPRQTDRCQGVGQPCTGLSAAETRERDLQVLLDRGVRDKGVVLEEIAEGVAAEDPGAM